MSFSSIMTFLCIAYILVYAGMILYDMFLVKEAEDITPQLEEVEIDKDEEQETPFEIPTDGTARMTGGMDFKNVKIAMEDLSVNGEKSGFADMMESWRVHDYAA